MWELKRSKGHTNQPSQDLGWTLHFGIFAFMLAITAPALVRSFCPTNNKVDTSWEWMLAHAQQHHLQWGKTILWTYGPLGFLDRAYFYPDHMLWGLAATAQLASWLILGLGVAFILRRLAPDDRPLLRTTLPVAIGWIVGASFLHLSAQSAFVGLLLLTLPLSEQNTSVALAALILSGSLLALGSLVKSTALTVSLLALLIYPALWWYTGHRKSALHLSLIPLLSFLVSFCALWLLSSQSLTHLPAYVRGTWAMASGYTPAMSLPGTSAQLALALAILSLFVAVLVGLLVAGKKARAAQCLLLGVMAFWAWKEGFTRQDVGYWRHPMIFYGTALLIAGVGTAMLSKENGRRRLILVYGAYAIAFWCSIQGYSTLSLSYKRVLHNYTAYLTLISSKSRRAAEQRDQTMAIQKEYELHSGVLTAVGRESMNALPWSLMIAQGYHMHLVASPVLQTYSVYTPYLDQMNAHQIWNGGSADRIIYRYLTLDGRYPAFDEPATFRAMLDCYRTGYSDNPYSVLSRATCTRPQMLPVNEPAAGTLGKWIAVPRQASYADIGVHATAIGHIMNILYKSPPLWVFFRLEDGSVKGPCRFVYPLGEDGLFVGYFIGSLADADLLFSGNVAGLERITAIKITTNPHFIRNPYFANVRYSPDYAQHFEVRFLRENPPHRYLPGGAGQQPSIE